MSINRKKIRKLIGVCVAILGTTFVGVNIIAKKKNSVYDNESEQKNPLAGKKVIFIENENDKENADGVRGHLEAVSDSDYYLGFYDKYVKRAIDIILSLGGLVFLAPIYLVIAIAIKIDDPGPVLFIQKRVGQNKEYFKLHKFRSMKMSTPHDVPTHMLDNPDQYITKVGRFLRAHSLDELPQIWDIFIGNMSIIGPRPALWNQDVLIAEREKYGANDVKPGLTGWAQINGRDELEIPIKAKLDGEYVQKESFFFDVKCFFGTVSKVGHDDSIVEGGTGERKKVGRHYTDGKSKEELIGNIGFGEQVKVDKDAKKKVLITGAGSYIGETFQAYAVEHYKENFFINTIDMLNPLWRKVNFSNYDIVYHVAGIAHADVGNVSEETKAKYYEVNTDLAIEVAEKAKAEGVKEFILMSSMIIYGDSAPYGKNKVIDEHTVPIPANFYGDSKLQADVGVRNLAGDGFKVIVLRPPMIYGKGSKGNYPILAKFAKKLPVFPDVDNERSMLYIENLCEFLCQIMLVDSDDQAIVLIPQNNELTKTAEMVKEINKTIGGRIIELRIFNLVVYITSRIPGKIGGLVNKAFGNFAYDQSISQYEGVNYQKVTMKESIRRIESDSLQKIKKQSIKKTFKTISIKPITDAEINVFIIGLRGYTQNYGGWEAFAHGLLDNWTDQSVHFYAFERVDEFSKEEIVEVNNVTCVRICEKENGSSAMMKYDKKCTDFTYEYVKKYNIKNPVMFHLGVRIGPYLWLKRHKIKKVGIMMMENPAGAEWRRTKWNKFVQIYLWISAIMMAKSTDCMICDNEGIKELYDKMLVGNKPLLKYIAYGVDIVPTVSEEMPDKVKKFFDKWQIQKDGYYLILGRFVPENNYEMMFKGFIKSDTRRKLLVICNYQTEIPKFYEHIKKSTGFEKDSRIIMAGTLYDQEILHYIRQYAHGYIHGHSVGGTNPGLLEAMAETDINILYDVSFNKYVGGKAAAYFATEDELADRINNIDMISVEECKKRGNQAKDCMIKKYSWKFIVDEYDRIIHEIVQKLSRVN